MIGKDWVDIKVQQIWSDHPGIGINECRQHVLEAICESENTIQKCNDESSSSLLVATPPPPTMITKARIKQAKAWIPYRQLPSDISLTESQQSFICLKLHERIVLRAVKSYEQADRIQLALEAMGVELNDLKKTWKMTKEPPLLQAITLNTTATGNEGTSNNNAKGTPCKFCGKIFPSRNFVFKHLRDETSGCGTAIFSAGQTIPQPQLQTSTRKRRQEKQQKPKSSKIAGTACHARAEQSLWVGDIPLPWSSPKKQYSHIRAIFYRYIPKEVPRPWIKRVVRKAYRKQAQGMYHGYAIVVFRDAQEAYHVCNCLNQQKITPSEVFPNETDVGDGLEAFTLKVQNVENGDMTAATWNGHDNLTTPGQDPPLIDQLRPLPMNEIQRRLGLFKSVAKRAPNLEGEKDDCYDQIRQDTLSLEDNNDNTEQSLISLVQGYKNQNESSPSFRLIVKRQGRAVPPEICEKLHSILSSLRWPARNEREGLAAERYLVLQSNKSKDRFYGELREACQELMTWADEDYYYSGVAVTKNFVASPHIDHRDNSFQHVISLGDFGTGGELCVEGIDRFGRDFINVVSTRNCIARVDGRHVHWVRTWDDGDRYSLVFFDTSGRKPTPVLERGVDEAYLA